MKRPLLIPGFPRILHGGDYNPDQWQDMPEAIAEDFRLMKLAGCNAFSVGIFAWTSYERHEGEFDFSWLDDIMDRMAVAGNQVMLATPSGAKPAWMSKRYPEIRRVTRDGLREPHRTRHNHCWSSPVYREKVKIINTRLAERYRQHPALGMWHLSNEYNGECFCDLCLAAWQRWLRERYGDLDRLNRAWWAPFWSHTFTAWDEIDPRDHSMDGMALDWLRFVNWQIGDFMQGEMAPLRELTPDIPCTTNFMGLHGRIDYRYLSQFVDLVADDQYPRYHPEDPELLDKVARIALKDDLYRCFKPDRPWMLMESCPDSPQYGSPMRLKPAAVHHLEMLQALGHGAEGTCYFQWRKGCGSQEKLHGAVVDHSGRDDTRVFRAVAELGARYAKFAPLIGSRVAAEVAVIYDWETRWGLELSGGPNFEADYCQVVTDHHRACQALGVPTDVIAADGDLGPYRLVIAPLLWMLKPGMAEALRRHVEAGGILLATYHSGICDEHNLCLVGDWPGHGLTELFGLRNEEDDRLRRDQQRRFTVLPGNSLDLAGSWSCGRAMGVIHPFPETEVLARFADTGVVGDGPALTVKRTGQGAAYYLATHPEGDFLRGLYEAILRQAGVSGILAVPPPPGVMVQRRVADDGREFIFLNNFSAVANQCELGHANFADLETGEPVVATATLAPWQSRILAAPQGQG